MEKLSYPPLIAHLEENRELYNQLLLETEMRYGPLDKDLLRGWMVNNVEPLLIQSTLQNEESLPRIFKALFQELLQILGTRLTFIFEEDYRKAWAMTKNIPHLLQISPSRVLKAVNSAIVSLRQHQPGKIHDWIWLMNDSCAYCKTTDEFLNLGRVYAWFCGMVHLKQKIKETCTGLSPELLAEISRVTGGRVKFPESLKTPWQNNFPEFKKEAGGFKGTKGFFDSPPLVALKEQIIIATDRTNTAALFADNFGQVLLPQPLHNAKELNIKENTVLPSAFTKEFGKEVIPFGDISSWVISDSTLVLTRYTSHYLYIYGWSK